MVKNCQSVVSKLYLSITKGAAAGAIGAAIAAKSPADGYTIVIGDLGSMVITSVANPNLASARVKSAVFRQRTQCFFEPESRS